MFQKVLRYTGRHRKTTYASILVLVAGVAMSALPYFFLYRLLRPLLTGGSLTLEETLFNAGAMALCMVLYGLLYVEGLALSHCSAYHTLENLRLHLQSKLEKQPLGAIQEKGVGVWKKMFIDDIESMELLLAHALPEGLSNLAVPVVVFVAMFLTDWKLGLLSLCSLPLGVLAMGMMYRSGMSKMGDYYAAGQKMNNTIVEYIFIDPFDLLCHGIASQFKTVFQNGVLNIQPKSEFVKRGFPLDRDRKGCYIDNQIIGNQIIICREWCYGKTGYFHRPSDHGQCQPFHIKKAVEDHA